MEGSVANHDAQRLLGHSSLHHTYGFTVMKPSLELSSPRGIEGASQR